MAKESRNKPAHIGGHLGQSHVDEGVLKHLIEKYNIKTMIDVGCGPGKHVMKARELGIDAIGVDGDHTLKFDKPEHFHIHDYTTGPFVIDGSFDLCWSCEFVEHVEEKYIPNFLDTFKKCKYLLFTFCPPQPKRNNKYHFNEQPEEYWLDVAKQYGFKYLDEETKTIRRVSTLKKGFVRNRGLFFINEKISV